MLKRTLILSVLLCANVFASASNTLEDYLERMASEGKKAVLVVGCGHTQHTAFGAGTDADHSHPDSWCVDIENTDPRTRSMIMPGITCPEPGTCKEPACLERLKESYVKAIEADAELDITGPTARNYTNKFDVVFLELISTALCHPATYFNAASYLKKDGLLIVEYKNDYNTYSYYNLDLCDMIERCQSRNIFTLGRSDKSPDELEGLSNAFDTDHVCFTELYDSPSKSMQHTDSIPLMGENKIVQELKREDFKALYKHCHPSLKNTDFLPRASEGMKYIMSALAKWGFQYPCLFKGVPFPYNARAYTTKLVMQKTSATTTLTPVWKAAIELFQKR